MKSLSYLLLLALISIAVTKEPCYARDCKEIYNNGQTCSGVYTIKPDDSPSFEVYCDMTNGGWTVFQRRLDGTVDFFLTWAAYIKGFGDLKGEFWLGLNKIHRLTKANSRLRVDMEDFDGNKRYAEYSSFKVDDADKKYALHVKGYTGNAGNSFTPHDGMKFSTRDEDNDLAPDHCAKIFKGAWWYKKCHQSNLNGLYLAGRHGSYADGVNWLHFKGHHYSLKKTEMKVKRN